MALAPIATASPGLSSCTGTEYIGCGSSKNGASIGSASAAGEFSARSRRSIRPERPSSPRSPADPSGSVIRTVSWSGAVGAAVVGGEEPAIGAVAGRAGCCADAGATLISANATVATIRRLPGRCMVAS